MDKETKKYQLCSVLLAFYLLLTAFAAIAGARSLFVGLSDAQLAESYIRPQVGEVTSSTVAFPADFTPLSSRLIASSERLRKYDIMPLGNGRSKSRYYYFDGSVLTIIRSLNSDDEVVIESWSASDSAPMRIPALIFEGIVRRFMLR